MALSDSTRPGTTPACGSGGPAVEPAARRFSERELAPLLEEARRRTGLEDFGGDQFITPLATLLRSCGQEADLNAVGRNAVQADVSRILRNRLHLQADRARHPEIASEVIRRPLVVVGLPRSGTTLLHRLLSQDPANRVPLTWECLLPSPPPERATYASDRRIELAERQVARLLGMAPGFQRIHPVGARLAEECVMLMTHSFTSHHFDMMYRIPSYQAWLAHHDLRDAYQEHRRLLQHLQWRCPGERWVLKAPHHLFGLPALVRTYPDLGLIWMHRTPAEVIPSVSSLYSELRRVFSDSVTPRQTGPEITRSWAEGLARGLESLDRGLVPAGRVVHLRYPDLAADPVSSVRRIYDHFEIPFTLPLERRLREFLLENPRERFGRHHYAMETFGLDPAEEQERYRAYCSRFGV